MLSNSFFNHDEMMSVYRGWDLKVRHFGIGELTGEVAFRQTSQLICSSLTLGKTMWGRVYQHQPDTVLIFMIDFKSYGTKCWGNDIKDKTIFICDYNKIVDTMITAGAKTYSLNWSKPQLEKMLFEYGYNGRINWDQVIEIECSNTEAQLYRQCVTNTLLCENASGENQLMDLVVKLLYKKFSRKEYYYISQERIMNVVDRIHCLIENFEDFDLNELSREFQLPVRTLFYQFKKYTGTSPSEYEKRLRLFEVNRMLRKYGSGEKTVGEIARVFGFHHMGQFGVDYKKHFGESPSATLQKQQTMIPV